MKKILMVILLVLFLAVPAFADITNGGFESGLTGWTITGQVNQTSAGTDPRTNGAVQMVGVDNHSARVGDQDAWGFVGAEYSSISQTWTVGNTFNKLYFAWAAVGLVPTNGTVHTTAETPWFQVKIDDLTHPANLFTQEYYTGNIGSITPGWLAGVANTAALGQDSDGIWYYRPWTTFELDVTSYIGDSLMVTLTTRDCTLNGHASYAYLDGFGSTPPPIQTPEPATLLLLGFGLAGLATLRKKF